jgi:hypothetical protein
MDEWVISSKKALNWFIEHLGEPEWHRRRKQLSTILNPLKLPI